MAYPLGNRPLRAYYSVSLAAVVGQVAGFDIFASDATGERGLVVSGFECAQRNSTGMRSSISPILDTSITAVPPAIISDVNSTPTTTIRSGYLTSPVGAVPSTFWLFHSANNVQGAVLGSSGGSRGDVYIPPGAYLTFLFNAPNQTLQASITIEEFGPKPV